MNDSNRPQPDHRELIPLWIKEEKARRAEEEKPAPLAVDAETQSKIEALLDKDFRGKKDGITRRPSKQIIEKADRLLSGALKRMDSKRKKLKLPTQYEREQALMKMRLRLPSDQLAVSPCAQEKREDVFKPRVRSKAKVNLEFYDLEDSQDVRRRGDCYIQGYAEGRNGGEACASSLYWWYRIWVPNFDTSVQVDRRLQVTPIAVLRGYYRLFSIKTGISLDRPNASVKLSFWTGIAHWHHTTGDFQREWMGWHESQSVVYKGIINDNIGQDINVPCPGKQVRTLLSPINCYGWVKPLDIVDFYVRPAICAKTVDPISYAGLQFDMLDVPFVRVSFETGYPL